MKQFVVIGIVVLLGVAGLAVFAATWSATGPGSGGEPAASSAEAEPQPGDPAKPPGDEAASQRPGKGVAAMKKAAGANRYLFAFFHREENDPTRSMRTSFEAAMKKVADRADAVEVDVTAESEREIVANYDLDRAPMPLVLALAPNGAVTGGFPGEVSEEKLLAAFASPSTEKCMKALQDNKLVFLCIQNATTTSNDAAMEGIGAFKADPRFAQATAIITLDPEDTAEAAFLADLQIDPKTAEAVTVFLAPPGVPIAKFDGATTKDELVATLMKASAACGPGGCGPGGCGPSGCPPQP